MRAPESNAITGVSVYMASAATKQKASLLKVRITTHEEILYHTSLLQNRIVLECLITEDPFIKDAREHVIRNFSLEENMLSHIKLNNQLIGKA